MATPYTRYADRSLPSLPLNPDHAACNLTPGELPLLVKVSRRDDFAFDRLA
jgi:hypothetical protein